VSTSQRVRLAQELHDGIAQDLVGLGYALDFIYAKEGNDELRSDLRNLRLDVITLIGRVRLEIFELRNSAHSSEDLDSVPEVRAELNRIFNEIIENSIKHSCASTLEISVSDNGIGGAHNRAGHHGLQGIAERTQALGGDLELVSNFTGTHFQLSIPMKHT